MKNEKKNMNTITVKEKNREKHKNTITKAKNRDRNPVHTQLQSPKTHELPKH